MFARYPVELQGYVLLRQLPPTEVGGLSLARAGGTIVVPVYLDGREIARATLPHQAREMQLRGVTS